MKGRKLGRGLEILLDKAKNLKTPEESEGAPIQPSKTEPEGGNRAKTRRSRGRSKSEIVRLPVSAIQPNPYQPRSTFHEKDLETLKNSVAREGILQPVLVRRHGDGYQLIAGERRFRAAEDLGQETVPAILVDVQEERMLELALVENIHRANLNPIETATAFQGLLDLKGWTQEVLATNLGISRPAVSNTLRLLDLPPNIQSSIAKGQIQMGHAKILLSIDSPKEQEELFEKIAEDRLTVRELEIEREALPVAPAASPTGAAKRAVKRKRRRRAAERQGGANVIELEDELSQAIGTKVSISEKKGKGVIRLEFYSPDDFQNLRRILVAGSDAVR